MKRVPASLHDALAAAVHGNVADALWCGPVSLRRGHVALAAVTDDAFTAVEEAGEDDEAATPVTIAASDIAWVDRRGARGLTIGAADGRTVVVKSSEGSALQAALSAMRGRRAGAALTPTIAVGALAPLPDAALPTATPDPATPAKRVPLADPGHPPFGRIATPFAPSALVEHDDGVLRAARWGADEPPAPVGTLVRLERIGDQWLAEATHAGGAGAQR